jgi:putative motility protein YjfB-like
MPLVLSNSLISADSFNMDLDSVSDSQSLQLATDVQTSVQSRTLNQARLEGQQLVQLIQSAGSVNLPHQGQHLDVRV